MTNEEAIYKLINDVKSREDGDDKAQEAINMAIDALVALSTASAITGITMDDSFKSIPKQKRGLPVGCSCCGRTKVTLLNREGTIICRECYADRLMKGHIENGFRERPIKWKAKHTTVGMS